MYEKTDQERQFYESCDVYDPNLSYEEYIVNIFRCLMLSDWHYSAERATVLIRENSDFIKQAYIECLPVKAAMVEVGFGCG